MDSTSSLIGQTLGQYQILDQIGQGGMAMVFKSYQPGLNRNVALKILPPHFAEQPDFTERFEREAQAIGNLHHPNILPVYDFGQDKNYSYIVMRFIDGAKTLTDEMKSAMTAERIIEVMEQVGGALDHAHAAGVIHRDVKPSNVLMDGNWSLLSDFGLAKMVEVPSELTGSGVGMGTPAYMSPEQGMGKKIDHRTDLYALGIILYEMLTGHVPHRAETPIATVLKRLNEPLPLPRRINQNIPEAAERVLLKVLAADPNNRFNTAAEMTTALKEALAPLPQNFIFTKQPEDGTLLSATPEAETQEEGTRISPITDVAPEAKVTGTTPAKKSSGLPMTAIGIGAIALILLLILVGIGVLIFRPNETTVAVTLVPDAEATQNFAVGLTATAQAIAAIEDTATPEPTDTEVPPTEAPTDTPVPTDTPIPTDTLVPTDTPAPTDTPVVFNTPTPAVAQFYTGEEIFDVAFAEASEWQADAVLSEISSVGPLNEEGKADGWILKFWSPSTQGLYSMNYISGIWSSDASSLPVPNPVLIGDAILDTKRLYDIGEAAGAAEYTAQGYRPLAAAVTYPLDENLLTWYLNYAGGDFRVVYTVIINANTGEVIQALPLE